MVLTKREINQRYHAKNGDAIRARARAQYYADHEKNKADRRAYRARKSAERLAANPVALGMDFIAKWSIPEPNSGCWLWTGAHDPNGYGRIARTTYGESLAHRYSYIHAKGDPGKLFICHRCDNPACVNPDHLFAGTAKQNTRDMVRKGRAAGAKLSDGLRPLTHDMKSWILDGCILKHPEMGIAAIARRHSVSVSALYKLRAEQADE